MIEIRNKVSRGDELTLLAKYILNQTDFENPLRSVVNVKLLKVAEENHVDAFLCKSFVEIKTKLSPNDKRRVDDILTKWYHAKSELIKVISSLKDAPFSWAILKERFQHHVPHDIDILVEEKDVKTCLQLLQSSGFRHFGRSYNQHHLMTPKGFVIDLYTKLAWQGITCLSAKEILKRRSNMTLGRLKYYKPSPEDDLLIIVAHAVLHPVNLTLSSLIRIGKIINESDLNWHYILTQAHKWNWLPCLYTYLLTMNLFWRLLFGKKLIPPYVLEYVESNFRLSILIRKILITSIVREKNLPYRLPKVVVAVNAFVKVVRDISTGIPNLRDGLREVGGLLLYIMRNLFGGVTFGE